MSGLTKTVDGLKMTVSKIQWIGALSLLVTVVLALIPIIYGTWQLLQQSVAENRGLAEGLHREVDTLTVSTTAVDDEIDRKIERLELQIQEITARLPKQGPDLKPRTGDSSPVKPGEKTK